ncbi:MAG: radical SAM protein [Elusimicrobia bacterium]|nr:radical SAM protein [Elusimicrobiota bacterium]
MALLRIIHTCNQECVFCSYPGKNTKSESYDFNEFCRDIKSSKEKLIQISGGEPFLLGGLHLLKLVLFAAKNNKKIEIQTNASLIKDVPLEILKKLIKAVNLSGGYFNINLSAADSIMDAKVAGVGHIFTAKIKGIKLLLKHGAEIRLTYIICRSNYRQVPQFVKFIAKKSPGIKWVQFSFVKAMGKALTKKIVPKYSAVSKYIIRAASLCQENKIKCEIDHIPLCMLGAYYRLNVDIGKMTWNKKGLHRKEKIHVKKCLKCEYVNICPGPRKDYLKIYGDI